MEEVNSYNANLDFLDDMTWKTNEARAFQISGCVIYTNTGEGDLVWMPIMRINIEQLNGHIEKFHSKNNGYKLISGDVIKYLKGESNNQMEKEIKDYVNWYIQTNN